jgi:hypothetical protein
MLPKAVCGAAVRLSPLRDRLPLDAAGAIPVAVPVRVIAAAAVVPLRLAADPVPASNKDARLESVPWVEPAAVIVRAARPVAVVAAETTAPRVTMPVPDVALRVLVVPPPVRVRAAVLVT